MATDWYLVITDGTTNVTIADGAGGSTSYKISDDGWAPAVAGLRRSPLGGRGPYEDVTEEMELNVTGATRAAVLSNLQTLARLLEQAERWALGENVDPVLIKYSPKGATVSSDTNPLQAAILGRADGDETSGVSLPITFDDLTFNAYVVRARVRFKRRGAWLANTETSQTDTENNGEITAFTLTATSQYSPTRIQITEFGYGHSANRHYHGGFLLLGDKTGGTVPMEIVTAEAGTASGYTRVADSAANARGGSVLRYTASGTTEIGGGTLTGISAIPNGCDMVAVFANVRPSTTTDFLLRCQITSAFTSDFTNYVSIPSAGTIYPRWVYVGMASKGTANVGVSLTPYVKANAASGTLDIDSFVVFDPRSVQVLGVLGAPASDPVFDASQYTLQVNHQLLARPGPTVSYSGAGDKALGFTGDPTYFTRGGTVYGLLLATGGGTTTTTGNEWRQSSYVDDSLVANAWTLYRRAAYLVPE